MSRVQPNNIAYSLRTFSQGQHGPPGIAGCLVWPAMVVDSVERLIQPVKAVPITTGSLTQRLVSCPDPTHKGRGSGYTSPISWASRSAEAL